MPRYVNRTGLRYGHLIALVDAGLNRHHQRIWRCACDCGREVVVLGNHLTTGNTVSCGCKRRINAVTHGLCYTSEYHILNNIIQRCTNPKSNRYKDYGGRGITVFQGWDSLDKFSAFIAHVGRRPSPAHSIDRIDNNGHYEPGNVRWATKKEQTRNTSRNVWLTINGEQLCLTDSAKLSSVSQQTIRRRMLQGMTDHQAVFT